MEDKIVLPWTGGVGEGSGGKAKLCGAKRSSIWRFTCSPTSHLQLCCTSTQPGDWGQQLPWWPGISYDVQERKTICFWKWSSFLKAIRSSSEVETLGCRSAYEYVICEKAFNQMLLTLFEWERIPKRTSNNTWLKEPFLTETSIAEYHTFLLTA